MSVEYSEEGLLAMRLLGVLRSSWRLTALAGLVGALTLVGLSGQAVKAAPVAPARSLAGCAPCIAEVTPANGSTATFDPDGKVTISFTAQLNNNYSKFVLSVDNTSVAANQIQVSSTDPTQPSGQYRATLSAGKHAAFVQVFDVNGPAAAVGWKFTVPQAPAPTATSASTSAGGNNATTTGSSSGSSSGIFAPKTLSIILFSIAGVGVLVMTFIAGMWYSGRRALRNEPDPKGQKGI